MIDNQTAYAAERTWLRDTTGAHVWVVAVRATFSIGADGRLSLADEQHLPLIIPEYTGDEASSSLRYDTDLGCVKPSTDVTVLGSAYAPGEKPVSSVLASLRLRGVSKTIEVFGDRVYVDDPVGIGVSRPTPFLQQSIRYEAAYGGTDTTDEDATRHVRDARNPIGRGVAATRRSLLETPAHTLEYPGAKAATVGPAGFGPLPCHWSPRREYAGTYDERWEREKKPLLPSDFNTRFALSAPPDQSLPTYLQGGEALELVNMTPAGLLRLEIPVIELSFATRINARREEHGGQLASVIVEPDARRLSLVFQSALAVRANEADYLDLTTVRGR